MVSLASTELEEDPVTASVALVLVALEADSVAEYEYVDEATIVLELEAAYVDELDVPYTVELEVADVMELEVSDEVVELAVDGIELVVELSEEDEVVVVVALLVGEDVVELEMLLVE